MNSWVTGSQAGRRRFRLKGLFGVEFRGLPEGRGLCFDSQGEGGGGGMEEFYACGGGIWCLLAGESGRREGDWSGFGGGR